MKYKTGFVKDFIFFQPRPFGKIGQNGVNQICQ